MLKCAFGPITLENIVSGGVALQIDGKLEYNLEHKLK